PLERVDSLWVRQRYHSESPFFQRVEIEDHYPAKGRTVRSRGVNKVQEGKLWCVVQKPDETVVHRGALLDGKTIVWSRAEEHPLKVERFRETVDSNRYTIIGWGYHEGDDPTRMPRWWFRGRYRRVR
ncbi:MAG: hypothetical protein D6698_10185, partial [Gammaproteobacteria bacterium]